MKRRYTKTRQREGTRQGGGSQDGGRGVRSSGTGGGQGKYCRGGQDEFGQEISKEAGGEKKEVRTG